MVLADRDPRTGRVKKHLVAVRIHSDGSRVHLCNFCEKSYKKPSDLCRHLRVHSVEQRYQCRHCPRSYSNKPTMLAHMRIHKSAKAPKTPPSGKCFPCEICDKVFPSNGSLRQVYTAIPIQVLSLGKKQVIFQVFTSYFSFFLPAYTRK